MTRRHPAQAHSSRLGGLFVLLLAREVPVLAKLARIVLGSDIYCPVPRSLRLPHPYGIVVHPDVRLGENVVVMHQVTIGQLEPADVGVPVIGDDVFLGAGAKVLGAIQVGAGARIGANAVVTRDVPPGATVVGANRIVERRS